MSAEPLAGPVSSSRWGQLLLLRDLYGPVYGSEDLCVLLYSLVRRERPKTVVELGAGLGVCTIWIANALAELGEGHVWSIDDGSHYIETELVRTSVHCIAEDLGIMLDNGRSTTYFDFLHGLVGALQLQEQITIVQERLDFSTSLVNPDWSFVQRPIDWLFSDIAYGPDAVLTILRSFLPYMACHSSIFIDSAPTFSPSRELLDRLVEQLARGERPPELQVGSSEEISFLGKTLSQRRFQLVHLTEVQDRRQNSTAWIRIESKLDS